MIFSVFAAFAFPIAASLAAAAFTFALGEALYLVFIACIERLLCRDAKPNTIQLGRDPELWAWTVRRTAGGVAGRERIDEI